MTLHREACWQGREGSAVRWDNPRAPEMLEVYAQRGVAVLTC